ncbi:hypothetical protein [Yoonia maritima]|uniref:hypothetical protein n=1 Tax=Yoonia maritima TaxID=1435347 RepID=UPI000D10449C|nr:hypothetical protein [Yoonia maritima]
MTRIGTSPTGLGHIPAPRRNQVDPVSEPVDLGQDPKSERIPQSPVRAGLYEQDTPGWTTMIDPALADPALIARIANAEPRQLAYDVATTSLRLRAQAEETGAQDALPGCDALDRQALLFEHLHMLCTESPEVIG